MKHEWKKHEKALYGVKKAPEFIDIPSMNFFAVNGEGHPNAPLFQACVEALYTVSYAVRMSYKSDNIPEGYFEYTVYPLEGVWDLIDPAKGPTDKHNFKYELMIRQPDFLTPQQAQDFIEQSAIKKKNEFIQSVRFETIHESTCIQMLHVGSYDDEPASFEKMEAYADEKKLQRISKIHREIYLSDARKVAPEKLKTILRFKCATLTP